LQFKYLKQGYIIRYMKSSFKKLLELL